MGHILIYTFAVFCLFLGHLNRSQDLLLVKHSGITPGGVLGNNCKVQNPIPAVLSLWPIYGGHNTNTHTQNNPHRHRNILMVIWARDPACGQGLVKGSKREVQGSKISKSWV